VSFDLEEKKVRISALTTRQGSVVISRSADGRMNVASIFANAPTASPPAAAVSTPEAVPWSIQLDSLLIDGYAVKMADLSLAEPFGITVDRIDCKADNLSTKENAKGTFALSMRVERKGAASLRGELTLNPPAVDLSVDIKGVPLKPLQPLLAERAQVILASGALNITGGVSAARTGAEEMKTSFKGALRVNNLSLLDTRNAEDLLKWDTLYLGAWISGTDPCSSMSGK
jgi:hypothetical protein